MTTAGLCSLGMLGSTVTSRPEDLFGALTATAMMVAMFGGVPILLGWLVMNWGRNISRPAPPRHWQAMADWPDGRGGHDDGTA